MRIGNVAEPGPVVKLAITRSSSDSVKASIHPAAIEGRINGRVTAMKARTGSQPRSIAASSRLRSSEVNRDCTTTATKHIVSVGGGRGRVGSCPAVAATPKLIQAASIIALSLKNSRYQRNDQPPHTVTSREA